MLRENFLTRTCLHFTANAFRIPTNVTSDDTPLHWPVLHKLSNVQSQWPQNAVVLPGKSDFIRKRVSIIIFMRADQLIRCFRK